MFHCLLILLLFLLIFLLEYLEINIDRLTFDNNNYSYSTFKSWCYKVLKQEIQQAVNAKQSVQTQRSSD